MTIKRFSLGTRYAGSMGIPDMVGSADGLYVLHADYAALLAHNELQAAQLQRQADEMAAIGAGGVSGVRVTQAGHLSDATKMVGPCDKQILQCAEQAWANNRDDEQAFYLEFARDLLRKYTAQPANDDSALLDWIEKNARRDPDMGGNHTWWPTSFNKTIRGPSLREAIARAIQQEQA